MYACRYACMKENRTCIEANLCIDACIDACMEARTHPGMPCHPCVHASTHSLHTCMRGCMCGCICMDKRIFCMYVCMYAACTWMELTWCNGNPRCHLLRILSLNRCLSRKPKLRRLRHYVHTNLIICISNCYIHSPHLKHQFICTIKYHYHYPQSID
jgi:hypothetical protein